jgi:hypothetical protein
MSPARRSTGATCRGRPRRRLLVAPKCHRHASRRRPCATRPWARTRVSRLAPPEGTSGQSALVRRPAGRARPSHRDLRPAKPTLREGRRSGRRPPTSSTMAPTAPTPTPCRGVVRGESRRTRRRRRAHRRRQSQALPRGICSHCLSGAAVPRMFTCPSSPEGAMVQLRPSWRPGGQPPSKRGSVLLSSRQRTEAGQPPSWLARSAQPPSRARRAAR